MALRESLHLPYKEVLQQQHYVNRIQISAFQAKQDEMRDRIPEVHSDQVLKQQIEAKHEALVNKEKENAILINQIESLERDLQSKSEELLQINIQLDLQVKASTSKVSSLQDEIIQLKLHQALIEEKNEEIDHLNEQVLRLQQEHDLNKNLLQKVYEEACLVLSLSEKYGSSSKLNINTKLSAVESRQLEKQDFQKILQSYKETISKVFDNSDKEQKQKEAQGNLAADRRSMLVEIQNLQAELRISNLQNQEKLQKLQSRLHITEEQGNKREHQLRRQAELLKYKLQQEQAIVNDLQNSLKCEQDRSAELRSHFRSEQDAVADLKRELLAVNQTLETSLKKEHDLQKELENLRCSCLSGPLLFCCHSKVCLRY
ncbi:pericentrin-like isoform X2 [Polypterus senegalus]|uniref:pericentrin-like isoform X2 n=1 Tax=Polypterus senegalus TaxID=55291 RepID=UPI0019638E34|nr:pericentrin-like isoform X2 [Polypterus senegalus]